MGVFKVKLSLYKSPRVAVSIFGRCGTETPLDTRWGKFLEILGNFNVTLAPLDETEIDFFVSIDYSQASFDLVSRKSRLRHRVLVAVEPPSVNPAQFELQNYTKFDSIIAPPTLVKYFSKATSWTPGFIDKTSYQSSIDVPEFTSRPITFGLLSSNKYSPFKSSLYELRKEIVLEFARKNVPVIIGGSDWDKNKFWNLSQFVKEAILYRSYLNKETFHFSSSLVHLRRNHYNYIGKVVSSIDFYRKVKFVICIESDIDDFSEKLFEVNLAGAVPLYVGPDGIENFGVASNAFVPMPRTSKEFVHKALEVSIRLEGENSPVPGSEWLVNWKTEDSFRALCQKILEK